MTARDIQRRIMLEQYRRSMVAPNYTPRNWWECDVFELTKAGYFREYEIKMTASDYRADAKKKERTWSRQGGEFTRQDGKTKHEYLLARDRQGPTQFTFVIAATASAAIRGYGIPEWAGIVVAHEQQQNFPWNIRLETIRPAPKLHRTKADPAVVEHLKTIFYYRFNNSFIFAKSPDAALDVVDDPADKT